MVADRAVVRTIVTCSPKAAMKSSSSSVKTRSRSFSIRTSRPRISPRELSGTVRSVCLAELLHQRAHLRRERRVRKGLHEEFPGVQRAPVLGRRRDGEDGIDRVGPLRVRAQVTGARDEDVPLGAYS